MARTGKFGGFEFDEEVFTDMMEEGQYWNNTILGSGILQADQKIMDAIGSDGNVATIPMYNPLNIHDDGMEALNNDGMTDNTPVELKGNKQTCMLVQRMKAFKAKDFTKELTKADPLTHVKNKVENYYTQVWENEMMNIAKAVMGVAALSDHVTDLYSSSSAAEKNMITEATIYDAEQAALGDMAGSTGLIVMHSKIYTAYQKMGLVKAMPFFVEALQKEIELPTVCGKLCHVTDYYTADALTHPGFTQYSTYLFGEGAFLTADKTNYENQYTTAYDPETAAGTEKFYTKQGKVLHPNGLSLNVDSIATESPTYTELGSQANYTLKFNPKNVRIGVIKSNG